MREASEKGLAEGRAEGRAEGLAEGEQLLCALIERLSADGLTMNEVLKITKDPSLRTEMYKKYHLI